MPNPITFANDAEQGFWENAAIAFARGGQLPDASIYKADEMLAAFRERGGRDWRADAQLELMHAFQHLMANAPWTVAGAAPPEGGGGRLSDAQLRALAERKPNERGG